MIAGRGLADGNEYRGTLEPNLRTSLPWSAGMLQPASEQDLSMLPTKPPEKSRVFAGRIHAVKRGGVPALFIYSPAGKSTLYVDTNLNGRLDVEERFAVTPDRESEISTDGACESRFISLAHFDRLHRFRCGFGVKVRHGC
jgi:hypothetical protein